MASVRSIVNRLRNMFRRREKPTAPRLPRMPGLGDKRPGKVVGHRGVATGLPSDTDKHEMIPPSETEGFVYKEQILHVHSSNVATAQYLIDQQKLILSFHNGGVYEYGNVTEQEAINFAQALSKGKWNWDNIRVRGSRTAHKKPYRKIK